MTSGRHLRKRWNCLSRTLRRISMNGVRCFFSMARIRFSTPLESGLAFAGFGLADSFGTGISTVSLRVIDQKRGELPDVLLGGTGNLETSELGIQIIKRRPVHRLGDERADVGDANFQNVFVIDVIRQT